MGDPSKVILLEELVKVIKDWQLLDNAASMGDRIVKGLSQLQVYCLRVSILVTVL